MDWWVWLGIVAAIVGILSAIDHWFRPLFRPLLSRLFKRGGESPPKSVKVKDILPSGQTGDLPSGQTGYNEEVPISLLVPAQQAGIKRITISATVEYVDGLPTANLNIRTLFEQARELKNKNEYKKAILLFEECLELAYLSEQRVALYNQIGKCYFHLYRYPQAINDFKRAIKLAAKVKDKEGLKAALWNLGATYLVKNKDDEAMQCFNGALRISRDVGNKEDEALLMINKGRVFANQGNLKEELDCFKDALAIAQKIGAKECEGYALYNLGLYYNQRIIEGRSTESQLDYYEKALGIFKETQNKEYEARVMLAKGLMHFLLMEFEKAIKCYNSAFLIGKEIKEPDVQLTSLDYTALVYFIANDKKKAMEYLEQSSNIETNQLIGADSPRQPIFMSMYYGMKGDKEKAAEYFRQSMDKSK